MLQERDPKVALYSEAIQGAISVMHGGERGIRTPETLAGLTVFKTVAFDHSAISPQAFLHETEENAIHPP